MRAGWAGPPILPPSVADRLDDRACDLSAQFGEELLQCLDAFGRVECLLFRGELQLSCLHDLAIAGVGDLPAGLDPGAVVGSAFEGVEVEDYPEVGVRAGACVG